MPIEFEVKLKPKDMFRFNMYHTYTGFQGIFSIVLGIAVLTLATYTIGAVDIMYTLLYYLFGVTFIIYNPIALYSSSKLRVTKSETLSQPIHYLLEEEGIKVTIGEASAEMVWKQIYKVVTTKHNLLIYSSRRNAYVVPLEAIDNQYPAIYEYLNSHVEGYRLKLKKRK